MTSIDAVVTNYKTPQDLTEFLVSWQKYKPAFDSELTVMNIDPEPEDIEASRMFASQHVHVIDVMSNVGYARACNMGARCGDGEVIALFNADVVLTEGALEKCVEALVENPSWGILGPRQVDERDRLTHAGILGDPPKHRAWMAQDSEAYSDIREDAATVSGAAYFIKRSLWKDLTNCQIFQREIAPNCMGAFLPTNHYYEEEWCSAHAIHHGYKVVYYGPVKIVHKWHRASPVGGWAEEQMPRSRSMFNMACQTHGIDRRG